MRPRMDNNHNYLNVLNGPRVDSRDYVILMAKSRGAMRFHYASIDPNNNELSPKLNTIIWARLIDLVDYATCVFKNCLYVIGGREKSSGRLCKEVHKYDPYLGRWRQCEYLRKARANHTAAAIWGKIFVFGGMTSSEITGTCESYEPLVDEWHEEPSLPEPRKDHACVATDNNVYVIGGASPTQAANDNAWVLSRHMPDPRRQELTTYEWKELPDPRQTGLGYRLARHSVAVCKDRLYVIGGVCHGQTTDGKNFIRKHVPRIHLDSGCDVSTSESKPKNVFNSTSSENENKDLKWHIGTTPVIESYKLHASLPDFSIDPELEELRRHEREEEEKNRLKEEKKRLRRQLRGKKGEERQHELEEEARRQREEVERRREEDEARERMMNRTFWKTNLPPMPQGRCSSGTYVTGNKIYVVGGRTVEEDTRSPTKSVYYYHTRRKEWVHAFDFPDGDLTDIDCCVLTVPLTNTDFKPMSYSGCKWVMW